MARDMDHEFDRGYLMACAAMINAQGDTVTAAAMLNASEIKRSDIAKFDLTEYDQEAVDKILAEPHCTIPT